MKSLIKTTAAERGHSQQPSTTEAPLLQLNASSPFLRLGWSCLAALFLFGGMAPAQTLDQPTPPAQPELARAKIQALQAEVDAQKAEHGGNEQLSSPFGGSAGGGGAVFRDHLRNVIHRGTGKTLLIHSSELDPKDQGNLEEDMAVMSHILDKALEESLGHERDADRVLGINVYFTPGPGSLNNLYLEGYGAVFMLNVGFPLLPPAAKAATEKEKTPADSAWEEAKEELYGGHPDEKPLMAPAPEYNQEQVAKLKDTLFEALKNAANIRNLKPDESITLCVFGGSSGRFQKLVSNKPRASSGSAGAKNNEPAVRLWDVQRGKLAGPVARGSTLTFRVKKSDVDAFAKGKLTLDEFRKKAKVALYSSAMSGDNGGYSWFGQSSPFGGFSYGVGR